MQRTILLEFNELCPALLDKWILEGRLPNFGRLRAECCTFVTEPDVDNPAKLEPWIQWYSLHTGLAYEQHGVFHLTEGATAKHQDIYSAMLDAGITVGSFASMNVRPFSGPGSFFVGDPWTEKGDAYPSELNVYNRFVSHNVREYSNATNRLGIADYAQFLRFISTRGLRVSTVGKILRQLLDEATKDRRLSYRRVAILDRLQFDVFRHFYRTLRPEFATFFINSTAHLQHSYWRHMEPDKFRVRPEKPELDLYGEAILFGYQAMDELVGDFLALSQKEGARLMFATALSQQPFLRHEDAGGQHFYRAKNIESFLAKLDIRPDDVDPTMTNQYLVRFNDQEARDQAHARLAALLVNEKPLIGFAPIETAATELYFGCQITTKLDPAALITDERTGEQYSFAREFYLIDAIKSGRHHPDGALWIQTGRHRQIVDRVSILDVFPTILDLFGVDGGKNSARRGKSLVPQLTQQDASEHDVPAEIKSAPERAPAYSMG